MNRTLVNIITVLFVLFCVSFVALLIFGIFIQNIANQQHFEARIEKTFIDDGNTYFVLRTVDGEVFPCSNEDNLFFGKFNSGDFLVNLEVGSIYMFHTVGYRVPFLSAFPNIISADLIR